MQTERTPGVGSGHEDGDLGSKVIAPKPGQVSLATHLSLKTTLLIVNALFPSSSQLSSPLPPL